MNNIHNQMMISHQKHMKNIENLHKKHMKYVQNLHNVNMQKLDELQPSFVDSKSVATRTIIKDGKKVTEAISNINGDVTKYREEIDLNSKKDNNDLIQ